MVLEADGTGIFTFMFHLLMVSNACSKLFFVNFRNSWGVLVFKVGGLRIRLGSVDGH